VQTGPSRNESDPTRRLPGGTEAAFAEGP